MVEGIRDSAILLRFRAAVDEAYGNRVERIVLYGSRARGDATAESDYDVAVFLREMSDRWIEIDHLTDITTDILYEAGYVIHAMPYTAGSYNDRTPLMHEIRQDGLDL